ncbi:MAG: VCBS repeat-containing protein, partial [Myxococcales bacterium]|nr:VCBS repeat-containing protein [Myxococcales bacterium]
MFAQLPIRPRFQLAKYGSLTTAVLLSFAAPVSALAAPGWTPSNFLDQGRYISKDVELVDLDNDGWIDILFANASWGNNEALPNQAYRNVGGKSFVDISKDVFGLDPDMVVEIRSCDLDNDGDLDLVLGATQTRKTRLLRNEGEGVMMTDITATHMNFTKMSVSDIECGDVDGDGDLDLALAQLGAEEGGAPALLWTNRGEDGDWSFEGSDRLPADKHFIVSSDVEFVDVDNDYDLDLIVSCWACENALFVNDGDGFFTKYSPPSFESYLNHGFEPMDLNGDGYLDLLSLSDGEPLDFQLSRHRLLVNDAHGGFGDMTEQFWSNEANYPAMDRVAIFLDYNSDGAADYIL